MKTRMQRNHRFSNALRYSVFGVLLSSSFAALPVSAQQVKEEKQDLHGVVLDSQTGQPVAGAYVEVVERDKTVVADAQGRFRVGGLRPGTYSVIVHHLGYTHAERTVRLGERNELIQIELAPNPVMLKEIEVISNRLERRRNSLPISVRAYEANELMSTGAFDALEFVRARVFTTPCPRGFYASNCVLRRGRAVSPRVYVDDAPFIGGLDVLTSYPTSELYLIEVLNSGSQIRIYTKWFTDRLVNGKAHLSPVLFF